MSNTNGRWQNGMKKRMVQGGVGVTILALVSILSPVITGHSERISTLEKRQESISVKVEALDELPAKIDALQKDIRSLETRLKDDIKNLEKLMILCNKDNPDLVKYLELNK